MRCNENKCQQLKMFHGNIEQKFDENQMLWVHFHYWHLKTNGNNWLDTYKRTVNFLSQNPNLLKVRTLCQKTYIEKLFKKVCCIHYIICLYKMCNKVWLVSKAYQLPIHLLGFFFTIVGNVWLN